MSRPFKGSGKGRPPPRPAAAMAPPASRAASKTKIKAGIWAVGVAAVIGVGALTGAQLKQDKQKEDTIREFRETTTADQIAALEDQKARLLEQRGQLQRKLDTFLEISKEREAEKQAKSKR